MSAPTATKDKPYGHAPLQLSALVAGLPGLLYRCRNDANFTTEYISEGATELTGYPAAEFRCNARHFGSLIHPEDRQRVWDESQAALGRKEPFELTYRIVTAAGATQWVWEKGHGVYDAAGELAALEGFVSDITVHKRAEAALQESEERFRSYTESAPDALVIADEAGDIILVNSQTEKLFGYPRSELVGCRVEMLLPESFRAGHRGHRGHYFADPKVRPMGAERELFGRRKDGSEFPLEISLSALHDKGKVVVCSTIRDITERKAAETKIHRLSRIHGVLSGINSLIVRVRKRDELFAESCRIGVQVGGFKSAWIGMVDLKAMKIVPLASAGTRAEHLAFIREHGSLIEGSPAGVSLIARAIREKQVMFSNDISGDPAIRFRKEHAERGTRSLAILPLLVSGEAVGLLALYSEKAGMFDKEELKLLNELAGDISFALEHIGKSEELEYLSHHDPLTGLANTSLFQERLAEHIAAARAAQGKLAVFVLDIERFKTINDTIGREAGDELLRQVAAKLVSPTGEAGRFARVGADRFAIVAPGVRSADDAFRLAETRIEQALGVPFRIGETELRVSIKFGVAMYPDDGGNPMTLFRNAEAALKQAKAGGNRHLFFTAKMTERVAENLRLENKLRQALEKEEFVLHYQPKVELDARLIVGVEALIRWQSPELGLVPPMKFISLLEETGLILEVGAWALRRAASDHRGWLEQKLAAPRVAVNVSVTQMRERGFVASVEQAIRQGVAPTGIDLEITESLIMQDVEATIGKLKEVRALGLQIAIDDFGTGYSSLAYLAKLPVNTLKIDRAFIMTMLKDPDTMTLVSTMISLAHSLRLKVVAEGVETEEQAKMLRLLRCDQMQGYLFSKPLPLEEITALLRRSQEPAQAL